MTNSCPVANISDNDIDFNVNWLTQLLCFWDEGKLRNTDLNLCFNEDAECTDQKHITTFRASLVVFNT